MHRSMGQRVCQWGRLAHLKTRHCSLGFWTQKKVKSVLFLTDPLYKNCMETLSDFERTRRRRCPPTQFPPRWRATLSHFFLCLCVVWMVRAPNMALGFGAKMQWQRHRCGSRTLTAISPPAPWWATSTIFLPAGAGLFLLETSMLGGSLCIADLERFGTLGPLDC